MFDHAVEASISREIFSPMHVLSHCKLSWVWNQSVACCAVALKSSWWYTVPKRFFYQPNILLDFAFWKLLQVWSKFRKYLLLNERLIGVTNRNLKVSECLSHARLKGFDGCRHQESNRSQRKCPKTMPNHDFPPNGSCVRQGINQFR